MTFLDVLSIQVPFPSFLENVQEKVQASEYGRTSLLNY